MVAYYKKGILFLFALFISTFILAAKNTKLTVASSQSYEVAQRSFNKTALKEFKANDEFNYVTDNSVVVSLWDRFWRWVWHLIGDTMADKTTDRIINFLIIGVGIAAVVFAIMKFSGMDLMKILTGKSSNTEIPYTESLENIHDINFDKNIEEAISAKNYRLAVRLLYLKSLKKLSDSGFIDWQINKTNSVYIKEINHPEKRNEFMLLTQQFEFIWYGEFFLESARFRYVEGLFTDFMKKI